MSQATISAPSEAPASAAARAALDEKDGDEAGEGAAAGDDAVVHAEDSFKRGVMRWGYFLLLNGIAGTIALAFFIAVLYADGLDPYMRGTYDWLLAHPGVTSLMAFSPLACSLLVGYGYASRARKRKAAAARAAEKRAKAATAS